jgi:hypothetical protein
MSSPVGSSRILVPSRLSFLLALACAAAPGCATDGDGPVLGEAELEEHDVDQVGKALGAALSSNLASTDGVTSAAFDVALGVPPAWLRSSEGNLMIGELVGLQVALDVTCLDAAGAPMAVCGPTTDSAQVTADVSGSLSLFGWTGTLEVAVDWRLSDLQGALASVEGSATIALGSEFRDWFRPVTYQATFTIEASVEVAVRTSDRVPTSGSVALELDYRRSRSDSGEVAHYEFPVAVSIEDGVARFTIGGSTITVEL